MTIEERIENWKIKLPLLQKVKQVVALEGGLTNLNYRVFTGEGSAVLRISHAATDLLGIDRKAERMNAERAFQCGVAPAVDGWLAEEQVLLVRWIEGRTLHAEDFRQHPEWIREITESLRLLHTHAGFQNRFDFISLRKKYIDTVKKNGFFLPNGYLNLEDKISTLENELLSKPEEPVSCHNDLLAENFIFDGKKAWIIDFEYSGLNEASFDLGNLAAESFFSREELHELCNAYWQERNEYKVARASAWSMISRYGWTLWASIQEAVSPVSFDFRSWGMRKWNSVVPELNSAYYTEILQKLRTL